MALQAQLASLSASNDHLEQRLSGLLATLVGPQRVTVLLDTGLLDWSDELFLSEHVWQRAMMCVSSTTTAVLTSVPGQHTCNWTSYPLAPSDGCR